MTGNEILEGLKAIGGPSILTLSPGPFEIRVSVHDARAAELMQWVTERWPELTLGETEDVFGAAIWWTTFLAAMQHTDR